MITVLSVFGTRPEIIKFAPVIRELRMRASEFRSVVVASAQHTDLLYPFAQYLDVPFDHDLQVMQEGQTPLQVLGRVIAGLEPLLAADRPDVILVQGDTITALAGAMAGFYGGITVGHIEAGLRSGDAHSPFPEEMNRRLITRLADLHFAATPENAATLRSEGVPPETIALTGNPVVDSLNAVRERAAPTPRLEALLQAEAGRRLVVLTTHRRESFGAVMAGNLSVLRKFVERHDDVALVFPVHPNPNVRRTTEDILADVPRIHLTPPLEYPDFITLLSHAWLVVSDSGGVQEEAPSLGKPLLILRENTERPEAVASGVARLVGGTPERLDAMLEEAHADGSWVRRVAETENPFGRGDGGPRIVDAIARHVRGEPAGGDDGGAQ